MTVDLRAIGGSALTAEIEVPKDRAEIGGDVPVTYVPARNTVFLALLTGLAEVLGARDLVIGANVQDYSGYPDCRPEFLRAFAEVARPRHAGRSRGRALHGARAAAAPLQGRDRPAGRRASAWTTRSRSRATTRPAALVHCGRCDACRLRRAGFAEAGVPDPSTYRD